MPPHPFWSKFEGSSFNAKYFLRKLLGVGAFGAVFQADEVIADRVLRSVAIKVFDPRQATSLDQVLQELRIATTYKHPCLIDCYSPEAGKLIDVFEVFGLVMELAGGSLDQQMASGLLPEAEAMKVLQSLAQALAYLHGHPNRIVHRDLKPANVLWVGSQWKLGDLGIVRVLGDRTSASTNPSNQVGTVAYMPPESFEGRIDPGWDVWSLGVMMVEMLTGQRPFPGQTYHELISQVLYQEPQIPPELPAAYLPMVRGCLVKNYQQRWTVHQALAALAEGRGSPPTLSGFQSYGEALGSVEMLEMIAVPGGEFLMGAPTREKDSRDDERPQHPVKVPNFYLGKYAVTNAQWKTVMGTDPAASYDPKFGGDRQPVVGVSWHDAVQFCQKLSQATGRRYRLPSEAEWEYACRAGTATPFYFGETISSEQANYNGNYTYGLRKKGVYRKKTTEVGSFPANGFGIYDMHGNVWEWCEDTYHDSYENAPADGRARILSEYISTNVKVVRGGSWFADPRNCRCAVRTRLTATSTSLTRGVRLACSLSRT